MESQYQKWKNYKTAKAEIVNRALWKMRFTLKNEARKTPFEFLRLLKTERK